MRRAGPARLAENRFAGLIGMAFAALPCRLVAALIGRKDRAKAVSPRLVRLARFQPEGMAVRVGRRYRRELAEAGSLRRSRAQPRTGLFRLCHHRGFVPCAALIRTIP